MWQPIKTAPRDGTHILLYGKKRGFPEPEDFQLTAKWQVNKTWADWVWLEGADREDDNRILFEPSDWQPLPAPPVVEPTSDNAKTIGSRQ